MASSLSAQITKLLGDPDWVIVHAGNELLTGDDLDARMRPKDECNRCGLPADRFSSFGEDYYRHADGTVHERVY